MTSIFVDTSGWMACADGADPLHARVREARDDALRRGTMLVTTDYVADETLTLIRTRLGIDAAETWWKQIEGSPRIRWEWIDVPRADRARAEFFRYRDKAWSFTDCTSLVVAHELRLKQVLATDHHFEQMGFDVLPGSTARRRR